MTNKIVSYTVRNHGFTLLELIISMTISLTIIAATYQLFYSQNKSYVKQDQAVETQQNLRAIISILTKELQVAGYDPNGKAEPGIVNQFPAPHDSFSINYLQDRNIIGFTADYNGDGIAKGEDNELIAYRLGSTSLERYNSKKLQWDTLSDNINALDFVYLDKNSNRTFDINEFRAVEISILAKTEKKDKDFTNISLYKNKKDEIICPACINDQYHRRLISITLQFRNLNL